MFIVNQFAYEIKDTDENDLSWGGTQANHKMQEKLNPKLF